MVVLLTTDESQADDKDLVLDVVTLKKTDVVESSGLAVSNRKNKRWWTHNDSGDKARLYAINSKGKQTGRCQLKNISAADWEDIAAFVQDGQPRLIVADCGDNLNKRKSIALHLFDEPNPDKDTNIKMTQSLEVTFPDSAHDCEAVAVDADRKKIILVTKAFLPLASVYELDLPERSSKSELKPRRLVAKKVTTITLPLVSAMDMDPITGDIWIVNYFQAFRYRRANDEQTLSAQLSSLPKSYQLPHWRQIEAVAVDDKHRVWVTSEGKSPPMGRLNLPDTLAPAKE